MMNRSKSLKLVVRVFQQGFQTPRNNKSTPPRASCVICFSVFGTPYDTRALVFDILHVSLIAEHYLRNNLLSVGDLWSFNYYRSEFIVSPVPDVRVYKITPGMEKFLVIASDGLWGVMRVEEVVKFVYNFDKDDICKMGDVSHRYVPVLGGFQASLICSARPQEFNGLITSSRE